MIGSARAALGRHAFEVRWVTAVAISVLLTGVVEFSFASRQLEERLLEQASDGFLGDVYDLEGKLASAGAPRAERRVLDHEWPTWP